MDIDIYKTILKNSLMAIGYHKIICDEKGLPVDYEFIEVNPAYERQTGLKSITVIGKRATEIIPHIRKSRYDWISTYGDIALHGGSMEFKQFFDGIYEYYNFKVYSPQKNYFITMFSDAKTQHYKKEPYSAENLYIGDVIDFSEIQSVVDALSKITNIAMAIGNAEGKLLVQSGFQDICTNFHRKNSISCKNCNKSDIKLFQSAVSGQYLQYKCLNHMWDISTPIIVAGEIIGAIYLGQFIYDDDIIDYEIFKKQAKMYGFDEEKYMKALKKVPRVSHQTIEAIMNFYIKFANMVALLGYKNINILAAKAEQEALYVSLKESEKRFASTIKNIPDAILIYDKNYKIQYANKAINKVSGKRALHFVGKRAEEIWTKEEVPSYIPALKKALKTKTIQTIDIETTGADDKPRNLFITFIPIIEKGVDTEIVGMIHDYTEQKQTEEAKRYQDALIREMGKVAQIGGWEFDPVSGKGTWTDEVANIHELDPKNETNMEIGMSLYSGTSGVKIRSAIKEAIGHAQPYDIELEMTTAKGTKKWVRTIGLPTVENGKVVRVHGSFQDITAQKQTEQMIKESEAKYQNLLEVAPVGIFVQTDGEIVFINPAGQAILGADFSDQLIGKPIGEIIHPDERENTQIRIKKMISGVKVGYPAENLFLRIDGTTVPVEVIATPLVYQSKPAVQVIFLDVTDRKKAKEAIEKLNSELEQMVAVRTQQLIEANRELDSFTYSVSHDLKAPLRGIDGYSKLLMEENEDQLDSDGKYFLNAIRQSVARMNQLIDDLLAFSRIERKPWQYVRVDLKKLATEIISELTEGFIESGGKVFIDVPDIFIKTSLEGLSMVIKNLIENAIKYSSDEKSAIVEIHAEERETSILIFIRDNGIGFKMEYHDKIFKIFERLHRVDDYPGTGIGLAIVKKVAERLNGNVWAASEPGKGSTFYFEIPKEELLNENRSDEWKDNTD